MKRVIKILFGIYILFLIYVLFLNGIRTGKIGIAEYGVMSKEHLQMCNFIPLRTVINYIVLLRQNNINIDIVVKNLIGNFILFVPMSFFAQILFREKIVSYSVKLLLLILLVEIIQYITCLGSLDVDDIILNMAGSVFSYIILERIVKHK